MVFRCRLLWDVVRCGSFCVRHIVPRVLMPYVRSERACGLATAIAEVDLGVVRGVRFADGLLGCAAARLCFEFTNEATSRARGGDVKMEFHQSG